MARPNIPSIPDDKIHYFEEQLFRELSHMFKWQGLPSTVPGDYLERNLVRYGYLLYYEDENIGHDILRCTVTGFNRHELPTNARTFTPNSINENYTVERNIKRLADKQDIESYFNAKTDGVLIQNMEYGQNMCTIVKHFARRLALVQQAIDTNLLYANIPYIFQTSTDDTRLSIEKMFSEIYSGKPFIITDKSLFDDNKDRAGVPTGIKFIAKEIMDVYNEIYMKFKETVGFDTAGVDKAERVNTLEIKSNNQHTASVVEIMLEQRQISCESINAFFGVNISVELVGQEEQEIEEEEIYDEGAEYGTGNY